MRRSIAILVRIPVPLVIAAGQARANEELAAVTTIRADCTRLAEHLPALSEIRQWRGRIGDLSILGLRAFIGG